MAWSYDYQAAPVGGTYEDLSDYCQSVRVLGEPLSSKRGSNPVIPYQDGEYSEARKFLQAGLVPVDIVLRYTSPTGTITHPDGSEGHVFENLDALKNLLGWGRGEHVSLRRTVPNQGDVQAKVECLSPIASAGPRHRYTFPMRLLDGMWEEQTLQTDSTTGLIGEQPVLITTGGNYEIGNPKITLTLTSATGSNASIKEDTGNQIINVPGAFVLNDEIIIDLDRPRTITLNGTRYAPITPNRGWWIRLPAGVTNAPLTFDSDSGTWDVDIEWRNKWL